MSSQLISWQQKGQTHGKHAYITGVKIKPQTGSFIGQIHEPSLALYIELVDLNVFRLRIWWQWMPSKDRSQLPATVHMRAELGHVHNLPEWLCKIHGQRDAHYPPNIWSKGNQAAVKSTSIADLSLTKRPGICFHLRRMRLNAYRPTHISSDLHGNQWQSQLVHL